MCFKIKKYTFLFMSLLCVYCAPQIYKAEPGFIPIKDSLSSKVEYFPERTKYLGFKEDFLPLLKKDLEYINEIFRNFFSEIQRLISGW